MATVTIGTPFPEGASVGLYPLSAWTASGVPSGVQGAPTGNPVAPAQKISNGVATFVVPDFADYVAWSNFGGKDYYRNVNTTPQTAPSALGARPLWHTGRYYYSADGQVTSITPASTDLHLLPLWVPPGGALSKMGLEVTTAATAGYSFFLVIYSDDGTGIPLTLLYSQSVLGDTATAREAAVAYKFPNPGLFWIGAHFPTVATRPVVRSTASVANPLPIGFANPAGGTNGVGFVVGGQGETPPATLAWAATNPGSNAARCYVVAS